MATAADLNPGDVYRAADGIEHTVQDVWSGGIRCYITHADGTQRVLFPTAPVTLKGPHDQPDQPAPALA